MGYKILLIHTRYKLSGGEDRVFENESRLMAEHGHQTETLTFNNTKRSNIKFLFFPFNVLSFLKVYYKIKKVKPDVVHVHNFFFAASPSILYAIKLLKVPLVLTTHNFRFICPSAVLSLKGKLYIKSLNTGFPWAAIKDKVYRNSFLTSLWVGVIYWLHNRLGTWKLIDTLIIPNPYALKLYARQTGLKVTNNLVCKANFIADPGISSLDRSNDFVFIGRLSEEKGIKIMLEAFAGSTQSFHIYGEGPMLQEVLEACRLHNNIHYWGLKQKNEVFGILKSSAVMVLPSGCMEMASLILIEALACGTPVIVSRIDTFKEYIVPGQTGFLFDQDDAVSLKRAIETFSSLSENDKKQMSINCRNLYLTQFTAENTYNILMEVYRNSVTKTDISTPSSPVS